MELEETIISLRIPTVLAVKARVAAAQQNRSRSALIRDLLRAYFTESKDTSQNHSLDAAEPSLLDASAKHG